MKTWLKGGLIVSFVYLFVLYVISITNTPPPCTGCEPGFIRFYTGILINYLLRLGFFFIIGAIIGAIIQKVKK